MPHAAYFGLSIVMVLLFQALSLLFALIETGATEPLSRNFLSLSSRRGWARLGGGGVTPCSAGWQCCVGCLLRRPACPADPALPQTAATSSCAE